MPARNSDRRQPAVRRIPPHEHPGAFNVPGAELVFACRDLAPSPDTLVVVNCAGRTRSIIGAQSLINAGVPNRVVALRNGTMGWDLAGLDCARQARSARRRPRRGGWAKARARRQGGRRFGIPRIDAPRWHDCARSRAAHALCLRCARPAEYAAGHVAGARLRPGGQLVQATDQYVGTLGARIVLVDDDGVRAVMTASWLRADGLARRVRAGREGNRYRGGNAPQCSVADRLGAAHRLRRACRACTRAKRRVVDLSFSRDIVKAHIPGAWFAVRSRLG